MEATVQRIILFGGGGGWFSLLQIAIGKMEIHGVITCAHTAFYFLKASAKVSRDEVNKDTLERAKVKSEMLVALETCRQLHKAAELSEDLQPLYRYTKLCSKRVLNILNGLNLGVL